ncbi:MAG: TonB family protein [Dokdonella sp.]
MRADVFDALMAMTLASSLALVAVLVSRGPVRRAFGARIAYATWLIVPLTALVVLLPAPSLPVISVMRVVHAVAHYGPVTAATPAAMDWRSPLLLLWLIGVFTSGAGFALQQRLFLRSLGRLHALDRDASKHRIVRAESSMGSPALIGAWRPRIVLPADFDTRYAAHERELIVAHEQMHFAQGDAFINAVATLMRCLNWFNPLVHFAVTRFRLDQELACDAAVIRRFPEARRSYADAMLKTQLAGQSRQELPLPAGCRWPTGHPLKERISMLKRPLPTRARRVFGITLLLVFGLGFAYVAWAAQSRRPQTMASSPDAQVDVRLRINADSADERSIDIVSPVGEPFSVSGVDDAHPWEATFVARMVEGGDIALASTIRRNGEVIGNPAIVVKPDEPGTIEIGAPGEADKFSIEATLALQTPRKVETVDAEVSAAGATYRAMQPPTYPAGAASAGIEGVVYVALTIGANGEVEEAHVDRVDPQASAVLGDAALDAVRKWRFNPAHSSTGLPVSSDIVTPIRFVLHTDEEEAEEHASALSAARGAASVVGGQSDG